jgi:thymidylate synthase (FAD)
VNIVQPYAKLRDVPDLAAGIKLLQKIEWCGRISHRSEEAQTEDSWRRFIETVVLGHGDWSIVEHASVTIDMVVDRGITHEWVRHRLCAFTQESTRFVNYEKKMPASFIKPIGMDAETSQEENWCSAIENAEQSYQRMTRQGAAPQIARSVFPNALASRIITTTNLRNLRHIMIMRTTKEAHPQMRQVTIPLLAELKAKIPIIFDDIEPLTKQSVSMSRMR